jgi:CBS domain-containing membrane protein
MTPRVHTVPASANLDEVSDLMRSRRVRHVPVVDDEQRLVGLVTHRDLLGKAFGGGEDLPRSIRQSYLRSIPVAEVMIREVFTAHPEDLVTDVACAMVSNRFGCLPVVDGERLVGILTASDFVRYVARCG